MRDTQYWLNEMERLEHAWSIGGRWAILSQLMSSAIAEDQRPVTHEALLANARECVDRDLANSGWRGVLAYVGTALGRTWRQNEDTEDWVFNALGQLSALASCEQANTCHSTCMCLTCPHAKWPDSHSTGKTDPEPHNPAPETQTARGGQAGAVDSLDLPCEWRPAHIGQDEIDRLRLRVESAEDDRDIYREQIVTMTAREEFFQRRLREEWARADKLAARRDKARARAEQAEATIRVMERDALEQSRMLADALAKCDAMDDHIPDATKMVPPCEWTYDELEDKWDTGCGNAFQFMADGATPDNNGFKHCVYCGGVITKEAE